MANLLDICENRQRYIEETTQEIITKLDEFKEKCYLELGEHWIFNDLPLNTLEQTLEELQTDIKLKILRIRRYSIETSAAIISYSENKKQKRRDKRQRYSKNRRNIKNLANQFMELSLASNKGLLNCYPIPNYFSECHNATNK